MVKPVFHRLYIFFKDSDIYVVCASLDLGVKSMLVFIPKGWVADQEDVEDDPTGPYVHSFSVRLFFQHLGTQVARSASES